MSTISAHKIKTLLDREDIENLLALGASSDEYQSEAQMIHHAVAQLQRERPNEVTTDQVVELISKIWQEMFGPFEADQLQLREPFFEKIASEICSGKSGPIAATH